MSRWNFCWPYSPQLRVSQIQLHISRSNLDPDDRLLISFRPHASKISFQECPPAACPADIVPCPDGSFVVRDPLNNCEFPVCPDGQCPLDTQQCPDGTPVSRIPPDCNFAACSTASCPTDVASCPGKSTRSILFQLSRMHALSCSHGLAANPCPYILCTLDGTVVSRDPANNCRYVNIQFLAYVH